jgi:hypothetical protein
MIARLRAKFPHFMIIVMLVCCDGAKVFGILNCPLLRLAVLTGIPLAWRIIAGLLHHGQVADRYSRKTFFKLAAWQVQRVGTLELSATHKNETPQHNASYTPAVDSYVSIVLIAVQSHRQSQGRCAAFPHAMLLSLSLEPSTWALSERSTKTPRRLYHATRQLCALPNDWLPFTIDLSARVPILSPKITFYGLSTRNHKLFTSTTRSSSSLHLSNIIEHVRHNTKHPVRPARHGPNLSIHKVSKVSFSHPHPVLDHS